MNQKPNSNATLPSQSDVIDKLVAEHYQATLRIAHRILRSKEDSEDAVQTAYCAALQSFDSFRGDSSFKTWITKIVVNCCLEMLRDRRNRPQVPLVNVERSLASIDATPEGLCYLAELRAAHATAATTLPKVLQEVYAESVISEVSLRTVADQLGLTTAAAKSRLFRARRRVEHALQPMLERSAA